MTSEASLERSPCSGAPRLPGVAAVRRRCAPRISERARLRDHASHRLRNHRPRRADLGRLHVPRRHALRPLRAHPSLRQRRVDHHAAARRDVHEPAAAGLAAEFHPYRPPVVERGDDPRSRRLRLHIHRRIDCFPDTSPSAGCVEQELQCGNYAYATATPQRFPVRVDNPCGTDDSNVFTLLSEPTRRRAVRH